MAFLTTERFALTGDPVIDVATTGGRWLLNKDRLLHWAITDGFAGETWPNPANLRTEIALVLETIEPFIDIEFEFAGFFADPIAAGAAGADLVYARDTQGTIVPQGTSSYAYFPQDTFIATGVPEYPAGWKTQPGDIFFGVDLPAATIGEIQRGTEQYTLILRETLQALGLKDLTDSGQSGRPTLQTLGFEEFDIDWISVMSVNDDYAHEPFRWDPAAPQVLDVVALQWLYGTNMSTNTGDDTYYLRTTESYETIWDAYGIDRVRIDPRATEGWTIELWDSPRSELNPISIGRAAPTSQLASDAPKENIWLLGDFEVFDGSAFGDTFVGDRNITLFEGHRGDDTIDGGGGYDIALYSGHMASYTIEIRDETVTVIDRRPDGTDTDTVRNVEEVYFDGGHVPAVGDDGMRLDLFDDAARIPLGAFLEITELYIAYFNRAPDALGLADWASEVERGVTREEIAESFFDQAETRATYPDLSDTAAFVRAVYSNVLGRAPDTDGFAYWVEELATNPAINEPNFILAVINGAIGPDVDYLRAKSDVGLHFAVEHGMSDLAHARAVMSLYDGTAASVLAANAEADRLHARALDPETGAFLMPILGVLDSVSEVA
ncbi:MAG: DUF4214 domain-containing protein [Pseudomonadota bacterium]